MVGLIKRYSNFLVSLNEKEMYAWVLGVSTGVISGVTALAIGILSEFIMGILL